MSWPPQVMYGSHSYQLVGSEAKIVLLHSSHALLRSRQPEQDGSIMWVPAYHLYRSLLSGALETDRLIIPSGGRTFYIHPNIILYAQSKNRRAELDRRIGGLAAAPQ